MIAPWVCWGRIQAGLVELSGLHGFGEGVVTGDLVVGQAEVFAI